MQAYYTLNKTHVAAISSGFILDCYSMANKLYCIIESIEYMHTCLMQGGLLIYVYYVVTLATKGSSVNLAPTS